MRTDTDNAYSVALAGMQAGMRKLVDAGQKLSREVAVEPMIDMKLAEVQVKASAKVARTVDRMLGQLIDDLA